MPNASKPSVRFGSKSASIGRVARFPFFALLSAAVVAAEPSGAAVEIDSTVVLRIGPLEISQYVFTGNFTRTFGKGALAKKPPSAEVAQWLERYLVQQLATARALSLGYAERPEVIQAVELMEKHMLSSPSGPLYRDLASEGSVSGEASRAGDPRTGATMRAQIQSQRRRQILREAQFEARPDVAEQVIAQLQAAAPSLTNIPEASLGPLLPMTVAVYRDGGPPVPITVRDWCSYYNQLYVRRLPSTASALIAQLEDMAMVTYDVREARRRQIDQTPKFKEDRRDFLQHQALDRFEKEQLAPQIVFGPDELQEFYQKQAARYAQVVQASGFLLEFPSEEAAQTWLRQNPPPWAQLKPEAMPTDLPERQVSAAEPLPGLEHATEAVLRMPDGMPLGPLPLDGHWVVFVRRSTKKSTPPLQAVAAQVRAGLVRERLDALERSLAGGWARSFAIQDAINYEQYGLTAPQVAPWARPGSGTGTQLEK